MKKTFFICLLLLLPTISFSQKLWKYEPHVTDFVAVGGDTSINNLQRILNTDSLKFTIDYIAAARLLAYYGGEGYKDFIFSKMSQYSDINDPRFSWSNYLLYQIIRGYLGDSGAIAGMDSVVRFAIGDTSLQLNAISFLGGKGYLNYFDFVRQVFNQHLPYENAYHQLSLYGSDARYKTEVENLLSSVVRDSSNRMTVFQAAYALSLVNKILTTQILDNRFRLSYGIERSNFFNILETIDPDGEPERVIFAMVNEPDNKIRRLFLPTYNAIVESSLTSRYLLPFFIDFLSKRVQIDSERSIIRESKRFIDEFVPLNFQESQISINKIDSLKNLKDSVISYNWLSDQSFVNALDSNLTAARSYIVGGDSNNCARQIKLFQQKVDEEYRDSLDGDNKFVTIEGWKFLYYNAQYIVDRLPTPPPQYNLNIDTIGNGTVIKTPELALYDSATTVTLTANPSTGYRFGSWSGDAVGTVNPISVVMNSEKNITATFLQNIFIITATAGANGTIAPSGDVSVIYGANQLFTITPSTGYHIGDVIVDGITAGAVLTYTFTNVSSAHTITATFAINTYSIDITVSPDPICGTVTKTPDQPTYNNGTSVQLTAIPNPGYSFISWTGDFPIGQTNPVTIIMNRNQSITANFAINTYTLTVNAINGSVVKTPDQPNYNYNTTVQLNAAPNTGYSFVNWTGDLTGTINPTSINMNTNKSVIANFGINTYTLTVNAVNGTVTKSPNQPTYNHGSSVQLTATPNTGYSFVNWGGDVVGSANPTAIIMDANKTVTANFVLNAPTVASFTPPNGLVGTSVTITGTNFVSISSVKFNGTTASYTVNSSTQITATVPTGATTGSITVTNAGGTGTSSTTFKVGYIITIQTSGSGIVTKSPNYVSYTPGTTVTLTAKPSLPLETLKIVPNTPEPTSWKFDHWEIDLTGTQNPKSITMNGNKTVKAVFVPVY